MTDERFGNMGILGAEEKYQQYIHQWCYTKKNGRKKFCLVRYYRDKHLLCSEAEIYTT